MISKRTRGLLTGWLPTAVILLAFVLSESRVAAPAGAQGALPTGQAASGASFILDEAAFRAPSPPTWAAFDVVAADMERDGDADVLVNWHNRARLELFENVGGEFTLANPEVADPSGLFENPGIATLYAPAGRMIGRIQTADLAGVFVWHDVDRAGNWNFYVVPDDNTVTIRLRANRRLRVVGLDDRLYRQGADFDAEIELTEEERFRVRVGFVATQLVISASLPLYVGFDMEPVEGGEISLWKDDPHGIAWVDVRGTPAPEIFITRGGLEGHLLPPLDPKTDRFFEYRGGSPIYHDARDAIPPGYGRGRRVEWVDVDGDSVAELYIGNTETPNALLAADGDFYRDVAAAVGLDLLDGDAFAWIDVDGNGLDDLVFVDADGFGIAYNQGERRFELGPGAAIGLEFPAGSEADPDTLFATLSLHVLDYDCDGRLDLWLSGHGPGLRHALYRAEGDGFVDVTSQAGLDAVSGTLTKIVLDVDNDGYPDGISTGEQFLLLRNDRGRRFDVSAFGGGWSLPSWARGVAGDFDRDGRLDLALMGNRRLLARNTTPAGGALRVTLRSDRGDPIGSIVRAFYSTGKIQAQRLGSAANTQYSQGILPLHFGVPHDATIERLVVRWPDGHTQTASAPTGSIELVR